MRALRRLAIAAVIVCSLAGGASARADKYCIEIPLSPGAGSAQLPGEQTTDSERSILSGPICVDLP